MFNRFFRSFTTIDIVFVLLMLLIILVFLFAYQKEEKYVPPRVDTSPPPSVIVNVP